MIVNYNNPVMNNKRVGNGGFSGEVYGMTDMSDDVNMAVTGTGEGGGLLGK